MAAPLEQWFFDVPIVTRWWTSAVVTTSVLCQCNLVNPFQLFLSFQTVWGKRQVWTVFSRLYAYSHMFIPREEQELTLSTVLAASNHLSLLRPPLPRLHVSHILHGSIFSDAWRIPLPGAHCRLCLASPLLRRHPHCPLTTYRNAFLRLPIELLVGIYLGKEEPDSKA